MGFGKRYRLRDDHKLPDLNLSLTLWRGVFEDTEDTWLRWLDAKGALILTGEERANRAEAEVERLRAELSRLKKRRPAKTIRVAALAVRRSLTVVTIRKVSQPRSLPFPTPNILSRNSQPLIFNNRFQRT